MKSQRGGFALGLVVGLLIGLALSLAVALYVTKVPVPFVNKVPQRTAEQDAAEQERNRNWDPNAGLSQKNGARPASPASAAALPAPPVVSATPASSPARDPAAILAARETSVVKPTPAADPFNYFVQAGAFARPEDAEQQRARLAMMGYEAKVSEREQSGRTVYRVRVGPFIVKDAADGAKDKLAAAGVESVLVRVQK
ncbi:SPOR domain-containing protein [Piscinibacter sp.]|uniref:SPOR domain-containing protein n=1 Tax=Piscinibacter sp. TaxID=1903157 RepID=UPI0039E3248A